jgi:hypothetical protein
MVAHAGEAHIAEWPLNWKMVKDPVSGNFYFWNVATGETTW